MPGRRIRASPEGPRRRRQQSDSIVNLSVTNLSVTRVLLGCWLLDILEAGSGGGGGGVIITRSPAGVHLVHPLLEILKILFDGAIGAQQTYLIDDGADTPYIEPLQQLGGSHQLRLFGLSRLCNHYGNVGKTRQILSLGR